MPIRKGRKKKKRNRNERLIESSINRELRLSRFWRKQNEQWLYKKKVKRRRKKRLRRSLGFDLRLYEWKR